MPTTLLLYATNHHLIVHPWNGRAFEGSIRFIHGGEEKERFLSYLDGVPGPLTICILTDLTEEEMKQEELPRLNPLNRNQLLQRRAKRLLRHPAFQYVLPLKRGAKGEKDTVLYSGLSNPESTLIAWLDLLLERRIAVAGIWSVPLLTPPLLADFADFRQENVMLLSIGSGGLRQTFLKHGRMRLSRLSIVPPLESEQLLPFLHGEIARMMGYLSSQRMFVWGEAMHVHLLCSPTMLTTIRQGPSEVGNYHIHPIDAAQVTAKRSLEPFVPTDNIMDPLFGQYVIEGLAKNHYARPADIRYHTMQRLRRGLHLSSLVLVLLALIASGVMIYRGLTMANHLPEMIQRSQVLENKSKQHQVNGKSLPEIQQILEAMQRIDALEKGSGDPRSLFQLFGPVFAAFPAMQLDEIEWSTDPDPARNLGEKTPAPGRPPPPAGKGPATTSGSEQTALFSGRVQPMPKDLKETVAMMDDLLKALRRLPGVLQVQAVRMPMNLGENTLIQGRGKSVGEEAGAGAFSLKILYTTPPKP
ncbi:MAG: hypothetical protein HQL56_10885 [Magnetococcales bacterium]|nr:hypothetical protein [Magnetococcales bacterium]